MNVFGIFGVIGLKGIDKVNRDLDNVTDNAKSKMSKLSGFMKGVGAGVLAVTAGAVTGGIALIKNVSSSYGALQQSIGGIETLFGESADKVIKNANNAFTTAGISANDYMQQVTSFSASLLQSLGGDTEKACDSADMAIRDMADNANKMGTSMDMIQNAYQGFAKQNYTMLDNLKLGYGGTKTEMERLLKDAQKISGVKYDISNLSDVYEAIHVIQQEMGITGTTAKEAGETIQGSFNSLGASWQNFIAGLGDPNADMQQLVENLATGISGAVKNIIPIINNMVAVLPTVLDSIIDAINSMLPTLIKTFTELITKVIDAIVKLLPQFIPLAIDCILTVAQAIIENLPLIIEAGIQLIIGLIQGISEAIPQLIPAIISVIKEIVNTLIENLPLIIQAGMQLLIGLIQGITEAIPILIEMLPQIIETIISTLIANLPMIIECGIQLAIALGIGLIQAIPKIVAMLPQIIISIVKGLLTGVAQMFGVGENLMGGLWNGLKTVWNKIVGWFNDIINSIRNFFNNIFSGIGNFFSGIFGGKASVNINTSKGIEKYADGGIMTRPTVFGYNPMTNKTMVGGEAGYEAILPISNLQKYVSDSVKQETSGISSSVDRLYDMINSYLGAVVDNMDKDVVLDSGVLVGSMIKQIDKQLGNRSNMKLRGNV